MQLLYKASVVVPEIRGSWFYYRNNLFVRLDELSIIQHYPSQLSIPCVGDDPAYIRLRAEALLHVIGCEFNLYAMVYEPSTFIKRLNRNKRHLPKTLLTIGGNTERFIKFKDHLGFLMAITEMDGYYRFSHFPTGVLFSVGKSIRGLPYPVDLMDILRVLRWRQSIGLNPSPHCTVPHIPDEDYVEEGEEI